MLILLVVWRDMTRYVGAGIDARSISLGRCQSAWGRQTERPLTQIGHGCIIQI